jgi:hypothetical protein
MSASQRSRHYQRVPVSITRTHVKYCYLVLTGAIIGIVPILLMLFVIVEFQALNGQVSATGLGLCRTDAHEPAIVRSSACDRDANKHRD